VNPIKLWFWVGRRTWVSTQRCNLWVICLRSEHSAWAVSTRLRAYCCKTYRLRFHLVGTPKEVIFWKRLAATMAVSQMRLNSPKLAQDGKRSKYSTSSKTWWRWSSLILAHQRKNSQAKILANLCSKLCKKRIANSAYHLRLYRVLHSLTKKRKM
jgi:hypothetical protein